MKPTYTSVIYTAVLDNGILSHKAVVTELAKKNMTNTNMIKLCLKKMLGKELAKEGASYKLSDATQNAMPEGERGIYLAHLASAAGDRSAKATMKLEGQKREEKRVKNALKAACKFQPSSDKTCFVLGMLAGV